MSTGIWGRLAIGDILFQPRQSGPCPALKTVRLGTQDDHGIEGRRLNSKVNSEVTIVGGLVIPSTSPVFLFTVGVHGLFAIASVLGGLTAMLSPKRRGRHSSFGTMYYWSLLGVFVSATALSIVRWAEDYHLFVLGACSFGCATVARAAARAHGRYWAPLHAGGMSLSYLLLLVAFYVDNGKSLPLWRDLPSFTYWLVPTVVAVPLIVRVFLRNPLLRKSRQLN